MDYTPMPRGAKRLTGGEVTRIVHLTRAIGHQGDMGMIVVGTRHEGVGTYRGSREAGGGHCAGQPAASAAAGQPGVHQTAVSRSMGTRRRSPCCSRGMAGLPGYQQARQNIDRRGQRGEYLCLPARCVGLEGKGGIEPRWKGEIM